MNTYTYTYMYTYVECPPVPPELKLTSMYYIYRIERHRSIYRKIEYIQHMMYIQYIRIYDIYTTLYTHMMYGL